MPAIRALAVVLTAWVLILLAPPGPASAGGPTSVLLSVPGEGRTASLYYTDKGYEQLADLVGVGGSGTVDGSGRSHESGATVTATWMVHDVEPWRVDRIYLGGRRTLDRHPGLLTGTGSIWDAPVVWHQPAAGKELILLLDSLGVGRAGAASGTEEPASAVEPARRVGPGRARFRGTGAGADRRRCRHLGPRPGVVGTRRAGRRRAARRRLDSRPHSTPAAA